MSHTEVRLMPLTQAYEHYQQGASIYLEDDFGMFSIQAQRLRHMVEDIYTASLSGYGVRPLEGHEVVQVSWEATPA